MESRLKQPGHLLFGKEKGANVKGTSKRSALERCSLAFKSLFKRQPDTRDSGTGSGSDILRGQLEGLLMQKAKHEAGSSESSSRIPAVWAPSAATRVHSSHGTPAADSEPQTSAHRQYIHPWKGPRQWSAQTSEAVSLKELAARAKPKVDTRRTPAPSSIPTPQSTRPCSPNPNQQKSWLKRTDSTASNLSTATTASAGSGSGKRHHTPGVDKDRSLRPVESTRKGLYLATSPGSFYPTPHKHRQDRLPPLRQKSPSPSPQPEKNGPSTKPALQPKPAWRSGKASGSSSPSSRTSPMGAVSYASATTSRGQDTQPQASSAYPGHIKGSHIAGPLHKGSQRRGPLHKGSHPSGASQKVGQPSGLGPLGQGAQSMSPEDQRKSGPAAGTGGTGRPPRHLVPLEVPSPSGDRRMEPVIEPNACDSPSLAMHQTIAIGAGMQAREGDEDWLMVSRNLNSSPTPVSAVSPVSVVSRVC